MAVNCVIVDDDKVFTQILEHYISKVSFLDLKKIYNNSAKAFSEINFKSIDLIFLDMEMPEMHGLEFVKALSVRPEIVFVSKHKTYGPEAYNYNAIDYLHKPVSFERFLKCADKLKNHFSNNANTPNTLSNSDSIFIRHNGLWQKLNLSTVCLIKADNNHVIITTDNKEKYRTNIKLNAMLEKLQNMGFMQVHRSYIVQLNKIIKVDGEVIEMNNKSTIPVSKTYLKQLYDHLKLK